MEPDRVIDMWHPPETVSRLVAERCEAHKKTRPANTVARWRIEMEWPCDDYRDAAADLLPESPAG